ncbi:MAG: hypothetical protein KatS3mg035_0046 [Bacteroidia bacterium]|nr:MAG: hypothetical protein KatS3mg035_0046 [Bacteroidia bacterium]
MNRLVAMRLSPNASYDLLGDMIFNGMSASQGLSKLWSKEQSVDDDLSKLDIREYVKKVDHYIRYDNTGEGEFEG